MTTADALSLESAALVARYESIRRLPRTPAHDRLRREIERRASRLGSVADPETGITYTWDDASESVVREDRGREFTAARQAEFLRLRRVRRTLGAMALEGAVGRAHD